MEEHYRIGRFDLYPSRRELHLDGRPLRLGGRAFDLLLVLVRHADRVVGKDELYEAVWPGLAVEPNNLQVHVWALRRLLGPAAIATVARRGYRLMLEARPAGVSTPVDAPVVALVGRLREAGQLTLVGSARVRQACAQAVAQAWRGRTRSWVLSAAAVDPVLPGWRDLLRELSADGGLVVVHDAHAAAALADATTELRTSHPGTCLLLCSHAALGWPGEELWQLPDTPAADLAPAGLLRWKLRRV